MAKKWINSDILIKFFLLVLSWKRFSQITTNIGVLSVLVPFWRIRLELRSRSVLDLSSRPSMDVSLSFCMSLSSPADKLPEHIWFVLSLTLSEINGEVTHVGQQTRRKKVFLQAMLLQWWTSDIYR